MRLGILVFDTMEDREPAREPADEQAAAALCTVLRSRDIDVVVNAPEPDALLTPERPINAPAAAEPTPVVVATFADAQEAGARLGRADCDGVMFWLESGANPLFAPAAALFLACPILLCAARDNPAFYDMAGLLADRSIPFDRLIVSENSDEAAAAQTADFVQGWLNRNSKKERQKGTEAAQKLWGKRLILQGEAAQTVDAAQWFHQFGVVVSGPADGEAGENDLVVQSDGYAAALALFLLRAVCEDAAAIRTAGVREAISESGDISGEPATLVQIYRRKGRFVCLLALTTGSQTDGFAKGLFASVLHLAPGDVRVRMKSACFALDIDVQEI